MAIFSKFGNLCHDPVPLSLMGLYPVLYLACSYSARYLMGLYEYPVLYVPCNYSVPYLMGLYPVLYLACNHSPRYLMACILSCTSPVTIHPGIWWACILSCTSPVTIHPGISWNWKPSAQISNTRPESAGRLRLNLLQMAMLFQTFVYIFSKVLLKLLESPSISSPKKVTESTTAKPISAI